MRETEAAIHMYERLSDTHKTYTHALLRLGAIQQDRKLFAEAEDWYTQAAALAPQDATSWALLGNLHLARREWGKAQRKFEKILEADGPHVDVRGPVRFMCRCVGCLADECAGEFACVCAHSPLARSLILSLSLSL
jgi:tetratricopeptide (TPR) repeat protein